MDYDTLVAQILNCQVLKNAVDEMVLRTRAINLIQPDWLDILRDQRVYKLHTDKVVKYNKGRNCADDKAFARRVVSPENQYNVIVAGVFSLDTSKIIPGETGEIVASGSSSYVTRYSQPLTEIGLSMQETPHQKLNDCARLFIEPCNSLLCHQCLHYHTLRKVPMSRNNWCVLTTRVYDGKYLRHEFKSRLEPTLAEISSFYGIFHVQMHTRTTFGDDAYKIGGTVKEVIIFQESTLRQVVDLEFASFPPIFQTLPTIEFPMEANMIEEAVPNDDERNKDSFSSVQIQ